NLNLLPVDVEAISVSPLRSVERQTARLEIGHTHVYRDETAVVNAGADESGRTVERKGISTRLTATVEQRCDTADTVAALFNLDSVSVEDPVEHRRVRALGLFEHERLVEPDTRAPIGQLSELLRRR